MEGSLWKDLYGRISMEGSLWGRISMEGPLGAFTTPHHSSREGRPPHNPRPPRRGAPRAQLVDVIARGTVDPLFPPAAAADA